MVGKTISHIRWLKPGDEYWEAVEENGPGLMFFFTDGSHFMALRNQITNNGWGAIDYRKDEGTTESFRQVEE